MKLSCNTIQDLLPLVVEDLATVDTVIVVNEHVQHCSECRKEFEELQVSKIDFEAKEELEAIPLKDVKRKIKKRTIYIAVLTALIISLLLFIGLDKTTKPIPLTFNEAIESTEVKEGQLIINFTSDVSDFNIVYSDSDKKEYDVMAWKNNISTLFEYEKPRMTVLEIDDNKPTSVHFINQGGKLDIPIYGHDDMGGRLTLPRLAINYYFLVMGVAFIVTILLSLLFRKKKKMKELTTILLFLTLSYLLTHIFVFGTGGSTHHMNRDLFFVSITALLTFSILILIRYKNNLIR